MVAMTMILEGCQKEEMEEFYVENMLNCRIALLSTLTFETRAAITKATVQLRTTDGCGDFTSECLHLFCCFLISTDI